MITSLSKLFRISLSKGHTTITVGEELEHARHYLTIQQMRFKRKFNFTIEADEEVQSCYTLKLILQPLIENAIVHGIEYMVDEGMITVKAYLKDELLVLEVEDNGVGMSPQRLNSLLSELHSRQGSGNEGSDGEHEVSGGSGVAIRNVHDRIRLYYGAQYGLEYESEQEEGTTVRVSIPILREQQEVS